MKTATNLWLCLITFATVSLAAADDAPVFEKDILPILQTNCVGCHGAVEPQGNLILSDYASVIKGGAKGEILKAGDSGGSKIIRLIESTAAPKMPPDPLLPLSKEETLLIRRWIDGGAKSSAAVVDPPRPEEPMPAATAPEAASPGSAASAAAPLEPGGPVGAVAFHPTQPLLAVGRLHAVELFAIDAAGKAIRRTAVLPGHAQVVRGLAYSPDGSRLAAAGGHPAAQGEVVLWDTALLVKIATIKGHNDCVYDVEFSPDGQTLATCSYDRLIKLWNAADGKEQKTLKDHVDAVYDVAFSPDGTRLASAAADRTLKIWSVADGKRLYTLSESLGPLYGLAFHPSGSKILAGGADKMLREWELGETAGKMLVSKFAHEGSVLKVLYSPDGAAVYSAAEDRQVKVWNAQDFVETRVLKDQSDWVNALALSKKGEWLAAGRYDGALAVYDAKTGDLIGSTGGSQPVPAAASPEPPAPGGMVAQAETRPATAAVVAATEMAEVLGDDPSLVRVVKGNGTYPTSLSSIEPKAVTRGKTVTVTVSGKNLENPEIVLDTPTITARILDNTKHPFENLVREDMNTNAEIVDTGRPHTLMVELAVSPETEPGVHSLRARTALALSNAVSFVVEEADAVVETEGNDTLPKAQKVALPAILAGSMNEFGDTDCFAFDAEAGQEWVFDLMGRALGSGMDPALEILSSEGKVLATSADFEGGSDARLGCRLAAKGTYVLRVTDKEYRGGGFYRIHASQRPLITSVFPLGVRKGEKTFVQLEGFNLKGKIAVEVDVPKDYEGDEYSPAYESFGSPAINPIRLAVSDGMEVLEKEGNDAIESAMPVTAPVTINGLIHAEEENRVDADCFRFSAKKGERVIVEVEAQRLGSPLDSMIEITRADGSPVEIATVRCVAQTFLTLSDRNSRDAGLRLDSWADLRINDFVMVGTEILRVVRLPDYPDEDVAFAASSLTGARYAYLGTTPGHHAVNALAYKVEIHEPGRTFPPNGMPVNRIYAVNDDGGTPVYNRDSYFAFDPPEDGEYAVKLTDAYGRGGPNHAYRLRLRSPQPSFQITLDEDRPNVPQGGAFPLRVTAVRRDGFDGPIECEITGLPEGFTATKGRILPGEETATMTVTAAPDVKSTTADARFTVTAKASVGGSELKREASFGQITVTQPPDVQITQEPRDLTLVPGGNVPVTVKITRQNGFSGRVPIDVRNLPLGVYVTDTGLNGILVTETESERTYEIHAEPWVADADISLFSIAGVETRSPLPNRNVSNESILHIRKDQKVVRK